MSNVSQDIVVTRKPHKCWGCAREFPKGSKMGVLVYAECGEIYSTYWCDTCRAYWDKHMRGEDGIGMGELKGEEDWEKLRLQLEPTPLPAKTKEE